jgi:hypothetical protein
MTNGNDEETNTWLAVIGRSLAFLCLAQADLRDKDLATQGRLLETLGMSRREAAALLGTSYGSLNEMISRATRTKKGVKRGGTKKAK